MRKKPL